MKRAAGRSETGNGPRLIVLLMIIAVLLLCAAALLLLTDRRHPAQPGLQDGYYAAAEGRDGAALRAALAAILSHAATNDYDDLFGYFEQIDVDPEAGEVWDIYSDNPVGPDPYMFLFLDHERCGNYRFEGDCYNREHTWPQSWFGRGLPMRSDLHHIYPTDGKVNGYRGNHPFGEVAVIEVETMNGSRLGCSGTPGYDGMVFEPVDTYKGDVARSQFYMATRYYGQDDGWETNEAVAGADFQPWYRDLLLRWHEADPVSPKELIRNEVIYRIQGNRNPFIDHPMWVHDIWGFGGEM